MNICEPDPSNLYPLDAVARMTNSSTRKVVFYCRQGVLAPAEPLPRETAWKFDEEAVARLRRIEQLRQQHRMNWAAIRMIMGLLEEVEALREELRFHR